ncbi:MAG: methyltransferase domain-containing protein [Salibacteraceae bacterium]
MSLKQRHPGPEMMDNPQVDSAELRLNLNELATINNLLGGHNTTFSALDKLRLSHDQTYHVLDIGCGGGDTILAVHKWANSKGYQFRFTGLDLSEVAISVATFKCENLENVKFECRSFQSLQHRHEDYDIVMCSLFCHHFYDEELEELITIMHQKSKHGFVINDLERNYFAWLGIKILTILFSRSRLVKNDAPLSVRRAFLKTEWKHIFKKLRIENAVVEWKWAFRHAISVKKNA